MRILLAIISIVCLVYGGMLLQQDIDEAKIQKANIIMAEYTKDISDMTTADKFEIIAADLSQKEQSELLKVLGAMPKTGKTKIFKFKDGSEYEAK